MKGFMYCVQDSVSGQFMPPFFAPNNETAKRDFILGAYQSMTPLQDLHLWKVASVDLCDIDMASSKTVVVTGLRNELVEPTVAEVESYVKIFKDMAKLRGDEDDVEEL